MISIENFIDIASVNDCKINESDFGDTHLTNIDPLAGLPAENEEPKYYRLQDVIFAEPISLLNNINKDKRSNENFLYNSLIPGSKFKRSKYQNSVTNNANLTCQQSNCHRRFSSLNLLKAHLRKVHWADRSKYQCNICEAAFPQKYLLNRHITIHESVKKECPVCHKKLSIRTNMKLHMRGHEQKRLHTCPECKKSFIRKVTMNIHIRYVHRLASLHCGYCSITFKRRIDYKSHLDTHVKQREIECEICGKLFSTLAALGAHKVKKHEIKNPASESS